MVARFPFQAQMTKNKIYASFDDAVVDIPNGATIMFAGNLMGKTQTMPLAIMTAMESSLDSALALSVLLLAGSVTILIGLGLATRPKWQNRL